MSILLLTFAWLVFTLALITMMLRGFLAPFIAIGIAVVGATVGIVVHMLILLLQAPAIS